MGNRRPAIKRIIYNEYGFSLLETLVAFALTAMVLASFYQTASNTLILTNQSLSNYQRIQLAQSILEEYLTIPNQPKIGKFNNKWNWEISTVAVTGVPKTRYHKLAQVQRVYVTVTNINNPNQKTILSTERIIRK